MAGVGEVLEPKKVAIAAVTEARQSVQTAYDQLTAALVTLHPLAPDGAAAAAHYRHARQILIAQLATLDNAIAAIAD